MFDTEILDSFFQGAKPCDSEHHAHLFSDETLTLKIYFDPHTQLDRKLAELMLLPERKNATLDWFKVIKINKQSEIQEVSFSESKVVGFSTSTEYYEGTTAYFLVRLDSVGITSLPLPEAADQDGYYNSEFYLSNSAIEVLNRLYSYTDSFPDSNSWKAANRMSDYLPLGPVKILLDYRFYYKQDPKENTHIIHKEPRLRMKHENLPEKEMIALAKLLCSIISYYRNETVDFFFLKIWREESTFTRRFIKREGTKEGLSGLSHVKFHGNVADFIEILNAPFMFKPGHRDVINKIVFQYIASRKLYRESRFMILYNALELIRNQFAKDSEERYTFIESSIKVDKKIRETLRGIACLVIPEEQASFKEHVIGHAGTIKYKPMGQQFETFLQRFGLPINERNGFNSLKKLRNEIFHGNLISDELELEEACQTLMDWVGKLIFKIITIEEPSEI